jgi:hypothetical protein
MRRLGEDRPSLRRAVRAATALGLLAAGAGPLSAQWRVGLGLAKEITSGFSRSVSGEERAFVPFRPLVFSLRAETPGGRLRGSLDLRYARPDLAVTGEALTLVAREDITEVLGLRPAVSVQVARAAEHVAIRGVAGPLVELWALEGEDARWRLSGEAGLGVEIGLGGRLTGVLEGSGTLTPSSPFEAELTEELERRAGWRWGLRGVVLYRP